VGSVGEAVVRNLVRAGFPGPVYPINPNAATIQSLPAYPTVQAVPGPVDLAVIAVPAERALASIEQCGRKGVKSLIVLTAGFNEIGPAGQQRQAEILRVCRLYGMRLSVPIA
jgi:acyl-CoA synthetase (NDP forming)